MTNQIYVLSKINLIPVALFQQSNNKQSFLQFKAQVVASFSHLKQSIITNQWPLPHCYLAHTVVSPKTSYYGQNTQIVKYIGGTKTPIAFFTDTQYFPDFFL